MNSIGFIGLGAMGHRMSVQLLSAGYELVVYDLAEQAREGLSRGGATAVDDAFAVANQVETVLLSLPGPAEVEAVVAEIAPALAPGDTVVDLSTSTPVMTEKLAAELALDEVTLVGAPVSGGTSGAETGTLTVMVGGPSATVARLNEVFEILGSDIVHIDSQPGSGHAMKLLNNYLSFVAMIATSEVVALGEQVGLETETMLEVFNTSSGRNTATSFKYPEYVLTETYDMEYSISLVEKDMQLLMDVAAETGTPFHSGGTIRQLIGAIRAELGADADYTEIHQYFQELMADSDG